MDSSTKEIKQFIAKVADKDYSTANQFLQKAIEGKLKNKIKLALAQKN
jgi:hypothetical protein